MGRHDGGPDTAHPARWRLTALLGAVTAALALVFTLSVGWGTSGGTRTPDPGKNSGAGPSALGWGFTHTQYSADLGDDGARQTADRLLSDTPLPQNQHIMGWGADNPEPRPGSYNFTDLDRRVALMRRSGGTPVLTLCCAPDWMKGGGPTTDWSQKSLERAPDPAHYQDFADLAGVIAQRYPDVRHFIVWNELKGFYDDARKRWDYEGYTRLYNLVYAELKKQRKDALVGGPYVVMDSNEPGSASNASTVQGPWGVLDQRSVDVLDYWNQHKAGADFVVVDGSSYTREGSLLIPDEFQATAKFADVTAWLKQTTGLPVWWAEWYVEPPDAQDERKGWPEARRLAVQAVAMTELARAGVATAFYWNPEDRTGTDCAGCLWRPTQQTGGGRSLPMYDLLSRFARYFPPGTGPRTPAVSGPVRALASARATVVVNTQDRWSTATVDGHDLRLSPYEVRWLT
ncbi:xylan 1,4-beta-xylosidase [Streptomyces sp. NPDC052396]|uniref:xylan 1,4-beta-xylosidase n=1 Tax=Streptomyces sp. NPDC052396 TaxID=3365689 RepID=UPI0037D67B69